MPISQHNQNQTVIASKCQNRYGNNHLPIVAGATIITEGCRRYMLVLLVFASDTGQMYRSWEKRVGSIDTQFTKAAYGFVGDVESIQMQGLALKVNTPFATIALSSLTDEPIEQSGRLLLTAVGRSENTGFVYNNGVS